MATEVLIPKLGMTMTEGTVAEWLVPDGAEVTQGAPVYRLETEKIEMEVEAEAPGTVRHVVAAGAKLAPGTVVAYILAAGEALPAGVATAPAPPATAVRANGAHARPASVPTPAVTLEGGRVPSSPIARRLSKEFGLELAAIAGTGPGSRVTEADVLRARESGTAPAVSVPAPEREVAASPLARRLAATLGVDLASVTGTGPGGRITKEDVEAAAAAPTPAAPTAAVAARPAAAVQPGQVIPIRGMRKAIFERMHASLRDMAQLSLGMEAWVDELVKLRTQLVDEWAPEGIRPTYTDLVLKAVAKALRQHPLLNAEVRESEIVLHGEIHVGMAVAVEHGLVVPVIRDADRISLKELAQESSRLATAAREGKLTLDEMAGGTFSVTALGMYGVDFFTPIVNPPNVAILGVGQIRDGVDWDGDRPVRRQQLTLSLSWDHRAVDGAPAAEFVRTVKALLEAPYRLLV
jgi:pyruvate dehydrogenase E2 component (dihydrolipoamide acetyltransferase)